MSDSLRERVAERAVGRCEYCLYPESDSLIPHQLDHIVAQQHGGADREDNLALCCAVCNRYKGPNLTSIDPKTGEVTRLFHPRKHVWEVHFYLVEERIVGLTPEGRTTAFLLRVNDEERLEERKALIAVGRYGVG
ncbi:MAG: HNH endonuclease [Trueperaceae bacterium]|nr:MAG: HNH endonuclease [Trueperaceae bacterium]